MWSKSRAATRAPRQITVKSGFLSQISGGKLPDRPPISRTLGGFRAGRTPIAEQLQVNGWGQIAAPMRVRQIAGSTSARRQLSFPNQISAAAGQSSFRLSSHTFLHVACRETDTVSTHNWTRECPQGRGPASAVSLAPAFDERDLLAGLRRFSTFSLLIGLS